MPPSRLLSVVTLLVMHGCGEADQGGKGLSDEGELDTSGDDSGVSELTDEDGDGHSPTELGGDDCDDGDPTVFAGASDDPTDGYDSDCNGPDELNLDGGTYTTLCCSDDYVDQFSENAALLGDIWGDGLSEILLMDTDRAYGEPGASAYIFDSQSLAGHPERLLPGDGGLRLYDDWDAFRARPMGDIDGDGRAELMAEFYYMTQGALFFRGTTLATLSSWSVVTDSFDLRFVPLSGDGPCTDSDAGVFTDSISAYPSIALLFRTEYEVAAYVVPMGYVEDGATYYLNGVGETSIGGDSRMTGVTALGDLDGDGLDELSVEISQSYPGGRVAVLGGALAAGLGAIDVNDVLPAIESDGLGIEESEDSEYGFFYGLTVAPGGDLDGDGTADVVLSAPDMAGEEMLSTSWLWLGTHLMESGEVHVTEGDGQIYSDHTFRQTGGRVASMGDVDLDGKGELLLHNGKGPTDEATSLSSVAIIVLGRDIPIGGSLNTDDASFVLMEEVDQPGYFGSLDAGQDVDGDGVGDMILANLWYKPESQVNQNWFVPGWIP